MDGNDSHSPELAQILFQDSQDAVFVVDHDQRKLIDANRAAQKFTGLNHQDLLNVRFDQIFQWQENGYSRIAEATPDKKEPLSYRAAVLHSRKGGSIPVQASVIPLPGTKLKRANLIVVRDARPLKALESGNKTLMERIATLELENAQLKESNPGRGFFQTNSTGEDLGSSADIVQAIAKQFNDLATVVVASATLVRSSINSTSPNQAFLRAIEEATLRASDMMYLLLGAVGRTPFQRSDVSLGTVLDAALRKVQPAEQITVKANVATTAGPLAGDPDLLGRAFQHLIQNAVDAMPKGGQLSIDATQMQVEEKDLADRGEHAHPGSFVKIRLSDSGAGLDADTLRQAGTPFFSTRNDPKKTGLGLAFVKGVCLQHGGWLELTSTPAKGTQATIFLPRSKAV
jgi:PAS domain S-box-containing protein